MNSHIRCVNEAISKIQFIDSVKLPNKGNMISRKDIKKVSTTCGKNGTRRN